MAGNRVDDILLTTGQNQGIEAAVLPAPQLISLRNMRLRKGARWGKRFGHTALSTANLGTGTGNIRAMGGGKGTALTCFALVDDRSSVYDQTADSFVVPPSTPSALQRVAGAASGWQPDTSYFPVPQESLKNQTATPCASCFAFGYLWTVISYVDIVAPNDRKLRVVATDPSDQTLIRANDFFTPASSGTGGLSYPKLILVGGTLVLTYVVSVGGGAVSVNGRTLSGIGAAWTADVTIVAAILGHQYDASPYTTTRFLVASAATSSVGGSTVKLVTTALVVTNTQAVTDSGGNPIKTISVVGAPAGASSVGGLIYVGYANGAGGTNVLVYSANLAGLIGTAGISSSAPIKKPLMALLPAGGVRVVYGSSVVAGIGSFQFRDVSAAGVTLDPQLGQSCAYPISNPFTIGSKVYIWTKTETNGASYATLLQLPAPAPFVNGAISCPIEMSVQDYLVSRGQGFTELDLIGVPSVAQLGTSAVYAVPVPTQYAVASAITTGHDFRILQARHYSQPPERRSCGALYADSSVFLPLGALTRIDDRGTIEEGFVHVPTITTLAAGNGAGAMSLGDYYYSAVYKSRNSNGRLEVSGVAAPVKVTLTGVQNQVAVSVLSLGLTARPTTTIEIYRTLANGQTFFLAAVIDSGGSVLTFTDGLSDTILSAQQALYTQVGQTLPNAFPPASRFGAVGGGRIFLGGQERPDIVTASKLIFGDQSPSFADADAFAIVLPAPCTGLAWMDVLVMFTAEGIYIANGDGPDDSGTGDFGNLTRMPYELGCIEPRSVVVVDDGCFFQTARGLYLLPRGFGSPTPAGDAVQDSLSSDQFPIITGTAVLTKTTEQTVHWSCSDEGGFFGQRIVYDLAHKAWAVDSYGGGISSAAVGVGQWADNEVAIFQPTLASPLPLAITNGSFSDAGAPIQVSIATGDIRPFGVQSRGPMQRFAVLSELRSPCMLVVDRITDRGSNSTSRVFSGVAPDDQIGTKNYTQVDLGPLELRSIASLRIALSESSTGEGLAFIALSIERGTSDGLRLEKPADRIV